MSLKLDNKVALVTGGGTGIGLATATEFAAQGARVFITGRRQEPLDAAVKKIGGKVTAIQTDVSKLEELDRLFTQIKDQAGHLDVLFANAGGGDMMSLSDITEEHFDRIFATNVKGLLFTVQKALPLLREPASIIVASSTSSITGAAKFSVYGASKAAVRNFVRSWILDLKGRNIRVNAIAPGPTLTPGLEGLASEGEKEAHLRRLAAGVPLGRVGDPSEIAKAALFLASSDSSFVNGAELFVDGGQAQI